MGRKIQLERSREKKFHRPSGAIEVIIVLIKKRGEKQLESGEGRNSCRKVPSRLARSQDSIDFTVNFPRIFPRLCRRTSGNEAFRIATAFNQPKSKPLLLSPVSYNKTNYDSFAMASCKLTKPELNPLQFVVTEDFYKTLCSFI